MLKAVTTFKDITKNSRSLKENTLLFFIRLLWILSKLPLSASQLRDLFFYVSSVLTFILTNCSTMGSLERIVDVHDALYCSTNPFRRSLLPISTR